MTNGKSSYLQYLPLVLWKDEPEPPDFSLGRFLLVFEKILTGLDDGLPIIHDGHQHVTLQQTIDELHKLYNPFKVQSDDPEWLEQWLAYLASWVGLELLPSWDEHQKRKLISDAVDIFNLRGLKRGLFKYLEIYLTSEPKPRIAIDAGESVFRLALEGEQAGEAVAVTSGPPITHPLSVEVDRTSTVYRGQIIIGDHPDLNDDSTAAILWRMRANGELSFQVVAGKVEYLPLYDGSPLTHIVGVHPLVDGKPIHNPVAIVDDPAGYYGVADAGSLTGASKILRVSKYPPHVATSVTLVWAGPPMVKAVDLQIDSTGKYIVLDRGNFDLDAPAEGSCQILVIDPDAVPGATPSGAIVGVPLALPSIIEPTALAIHPDGDYIVADIGDSQFGPGGAGASFRPTKIYRVNSATGATESLLAGLPASGPRPVFPTALYVEDTEHILILDYGVKERVGTAPLVQPITVWRLSILPAAPSLEIVSQDVVYVWPLDMTTDLKGNLLVADRGDAGSDRDWRAPENPHEFGVILHFTAASPEAMRTARAISDIIRAEKPAETHFTLKR